MSPSFNELLAGPALGLMPELTLVFLLACQPWRAHITPGTTPHLVALVTRVLVVTGLVTSLGVTSAPFWYLLSSFYLVSIALKYDRADNHQYLIAYWCLAIGIAIHTGGSDGEPQLARNAALLIGLCFAVAVIAKLASRAYRNGSFFVWLLATEARFAPLAMFVGKLTPPLREQHLAALRKVSHGVSARESVPLPPELRRLAVALTWWTVAIEAVVAVLFLWPSSGQLDVGRALFLVIFVITTFGFVAVPTFGELLLLMMIATTANVAIRWSIVLLLLWLAVFSFIPQAVMRLTSGVRLLSKRSGGTLDEPRLQDLSL